MAALRDGMLFCHSCIDYDGGDRNMIEAAILILDARAEEAEACGFPAKATQYRADAESLDKFRVEIPPTYRFLGPEGDEFA